MCVLCVYYVRLRTICSVRKQDRESIIIDYFTFACVCALECLFLISLLILVAVREINSCAYMAVESLM